MKKTLLPVLIEPFERRGVLHLGMVAIGSVACGGVGSGSGFVPTGDGAVNDGNAADSGAAVDTDSDDAGEDVPTMCADAPTMAGALTDFPAMTWTLFRGSRVIVANDGAGLYAYSAVCTHQGCVVNDPDSFGSTFCACHGAAYDPNGVVTQGPARRALVHYALTVCNGNVSVDRTMIVGAEVRTPAL